jgi:hypothetical protein
MNANRPCKEAGFRFQRMVFSLLGNTLAGTMRFTLRTKSKVDVQWKLFALIHNIGKIHIFGALT